MPHNPLPVGHGSVSTTTKRGRALCIRHIEPTDAPLLVDLFQRLSPHSRQMRFMTTRTDVPDELMWSEAQRLSTIDPHLEAALVGTVCEQDRDAVVAVVRLVSDARNPRAAEFALLVRDDYQSEGVGSVLFDLLLQIALVRGLDRLFGVTYVENVGMRRLIRKMGLPFHTSSSRGETILTIMLGT